MDDNFSYCYSTYVRDGLVLTQKGDKISEREKRGFRRRVPEAGWLIQRGKRELFINPYYYGGP